MKLDKVLNRDNINKNLLNIEYAVRGPIELRATHIERELEKGVVKPFASVIRANVGDCHALGQKPITFIRQVLAAAASPSLLTSADIPDDVKERVRELLDHCTQGSVGAYSPPKGLSIVREHGAQYLEARDGVPADIDDIYLGSGASELINAVLNLFAQDVDGKPPGVMVPIPQYPLFSGTLSKLGIRRVDYYLDEEHEWQVTVEELQRAWSEAQPTCCVRVLVVINPGNPTGQVLTRENIEKIIMFAYEHNLFILADEVYQENIVCKPFISLKKVMHELGHPYSSMSMCSCLTVSKGWAAECGLRAAMLELLRPSTDMSRAFNAMRALGQCPNVLGQCALDCVLKPPAPGSPSFPLFRSELRYIKRVLTDRARDAALAFNSIPGYSCNTIDGSMFAFPRIEIPVRAQRVARDNNMAPDEFYCLMLLEQTGVCVVAGSGFGQLPGTFHLRTTILHPPQQFTHIITAITDFHTRFIHMYS